MEQSAVMWLVEQLENHNGVTRAGFEKCIQEAISMEKKQILDAYGHGQNNAYGYYHNISPKIIEPIEYYNQTFNIK